MITGTLGGDKITQIVYKVLDPLWKRRVDLSPHPGDDLEDAFERLCKQTPGFGPFLAYEVVSDLRWTPLLEDADDIWQWANPGPGAMRGINRLLDIPVGRHPTKRRPSGHPWYYPVKVLDKEEYIGWMEELMYISEDGWLDDHVPELEMRDVEHSLCEYDKYMRTKLGQGRPRSKYTPPHER